MATLTVAVSSMATNRAMVFQSSASQPKHKGSLTADRLKFCLGKGTQTKFLRSNTGLLETGQLRAERAIKCRGSQVSIDVKEKVSTAKETPVLPFRVGHGFDLHRLEPGLPFIIGGINIPHDRGCEAHSDGDVLLHCVVDAILGALSLPDIGQLFPDNDPKWRGAPSSVFVKEAVKRMHLAGYELGNLDATLILQRPKLSPFKEAIRSNLSELLGADLSAINIKAKTHEKVDSLGENRSVAAHTVVLLMRKQS